MKKTDIEILLRKFYEGTSTEEEEKILKEFFRHTDIEWPEVDKNIINYLNEAASVPAPSDDFETRIIASVKNRNKLTVKRYVSSIAAALVILISGTWYISERYRVEDTFSDPEIAYAEAVRILYEISLIINSATDELKSVSELRPGYNNSGSGIALHKSLEQLQYIDKFIELNNSEKSENQ